MSRVRNRLVKVFVCAGLALSVALACTPLFASEPEPTAEQRMKLGQAAYDRGAFDEALQQWQQAAQLCTTQHDTKGQVRALMSLGAVYQALGQHRLAFRTLEHASQLAESSLDHPSLLVAKSGLGVACGCLSQFQQAEQTLRSALAATRKKGDASIAAIIWNNLGNLLAAQDKIDEALSAFAESAKLARQVTNQMLVAKASANAAAVAVHAERDADAERLNQAAQEGLDDQPLTHDLALLYLRCGQTQWQLHQRRLRGDEKNLTQAEQSYGRALAVTENLGDKRAMTYALGCLGQLYEARGDIVPALDFTRRAAFVAQEIQLPDAMYRWEWQIGRLLRAQGDRDAAIAAYRSALHTLQPIRRNLLFGYGPAGMTFREAVGAVFFELTDLLLEKADAVNDPTEVQRILREARDTIEQLKSVELEDYLQDECINLLRAKAARVEDIGQKTAVVYIIPLPTRTELLVGIGSELKRVRVAVGAERLTQEVRLFRSHLERRITNDYLMEARRLYQWLIAPIRELLDAGSIQTLVFVPDGALRTIPMSALQDGEKFLIEQFAVAVSPGLTLLGPQPTQWSRVQALKAGLAEAVQNYPPLPYVTAELETVQKLFGGPKLIDQDFMWPTLKKDFAEAQYQVVHFATHSQIDRDASKSYILTHDGKLTLDQLEDLLRPTQFRGRPVELLTLSACQTAAGDDRAALGLAGVAVKAGARSALATLWFVHDESTALLMGEFYSQLKNDPSVTKARALQLAQLKVLRDGRFEHPSYWAPYLMIGNWL
jgi:CHAT domain-containing protein